MPGGSNIGGGVTAIRLADLQGGEAMPALLAGSVLGIVAFRNINEVGFRRAILVLLVISGASLALA